MCQSLLLILNLLCKIVLRVNRGEGTRCGGLSFLQGKTKHEKQRHSVQTTLDTPLWLPILAERWQVILKGQSGILRASLRQAYIPEENAEALTVMTSGPTVALVLLLTDK